MNYCNICGAPIASTGCAKCKEQINCHQSPSSRSEDGELITDEEILAASAAGEGPKLSAWTRVIERMHLAEQGLQSALDAHVAAEAELASLRDQQRELVTAKLEQALEHMRHTAQPKETRDRFAAAYQLVESAWRASQPPAAIEKEPGE